MVTTSQGEIARVKMESMDDGKVDAKQAVMGLARRSVRSFDSFLRVARVLLGAPAAAHAWSCWV